MIRRPPRSTRVRSSAASDVYKRQAHRCDDRLNSPIPNRTRAHAHRGYLETSPRIGVRPDSVQVFGGTLSFAAAHRLLVWLSFGLRPAEHRGEAWLKRGLPSSK